MTMDSGGDKLKLNTTEITPDVALSLDGSVSTAAPDCLGVSVSSSTAFHTTDDHALLSASVNSGAPVPQPINYIQHGVPSYPRVITAWDLLQESDDESIFCGPASDSDDTKYIFDKNALDLRNGASNEYVWRQPLRFSTQYGATAKQQASDLALEKLGELRRSVGSESDALRRGSLASSASAATPIPSASRSDVHLDSSSCQSPLIRPKGPLVGKDQKFICVFQVGLEDDEEFCLVKRILGKHGKNMRNIYEECHSKVRLRGKGSGYMESGKEANMPLQLNVSCHNFEGYSAAVHEIAKLLNDLYEHFRKYAKTKNEEPPDLKIKLEEVRRDDHKKMLLRESWSSADGLPENGSGQSEERTRIGTADDSSEWNANTIDDCSDEAGWPKPEAAEVEESIQTSATNAETYSHQKQQNRPILTWKPMLSRPVAKENEERKACPWETPKVDCTPDPWQESATETKWESSWWTPNSNRVYQSGVCNSWSAGQWSYDADYGDGQAWASSTRDKSSSTSAKGWNWSHPASDYSWVGAGRDKGRK